MLKALKYLLSDNEPQQKMLGRVTPNVENLLNRIIYGQFINDSVIWFDGKQEEFIKQGYQKNATVYAIVRKIADKVKTAELQVFKPNKEKNRFKSLKYSGKDLSFHHSKILKKEMEYVLESDMFYELLNKPNPRQSFTDFIDEAATWYYSTGEVFIYGVGPGEDSRNAGKYTEMYCLPSYLVEIVLDSNRANLSDPVLGYKLRLGDNTIIIPKEDVLHIKETNLEWDLNGSQLRGQPRLLAGANILLKNNLGVEAGAKSNKNQGAKGIVTPDIANPEYLLDPVQMEQLSQQVDKRVNGTANRDKIAVSGLPMKYSQIGLSAVAMDLIESLKYDDEKLCNLYGVHPVLFRPTATRAELEVAQKALVTDVVMPFLNIFERSLENWLNPVFGTNYSIDFDTSSFPELQPDVKLIMDAYRDNATITKNELRLMLGFSEIDSDGANTLWVKSSDVPIDEAMISLSADFSDFTRDA